MKPLYVDPVMVGKRINESIKSKGFSISEIADEIGIYRSHLHKLLKGRHPWPDEYIAIMSDYLEEPFDYLKYGL